MLKASDILREHFSRYRAQKDEGPAKQGRISPSKIAAGCLFSVYCDVTEAPHEPEVRKFNDWITLIIGHFLHDMLQKFFAWFYAERGDVYLPEHKVHIADNCYGSIDGLVIYRDGTSAVIDYKTCSDNVFTSLGRKASPVYEDQVRLYQHGAGADSGSILYINRSNFQVKEFDVPADEDRLTMLLDRIDTVNKAVEARVPPPATAYWMGTAQCTKVCGYRKVCPLAMRSKSSKL